ncbi:unnamed protein product [Arabis nemorensis]|uniref:Uncharacterized protein n=1 Tax=Arabis nemorensis TaxID=586526 RepID=A0A565BAY6_9BRAS|nr:unnamed protein product [Arabis nemorensis]
MDGQTKTQQEFNKKVMELKQHVDGGYTDFQSKFEALNSQFKSLDNRVAHFASSSKRTPCTLSGKCEANPKEICNATFLEDEYCEEIMEEHLGEDDSDDEVDGIRTPPAEENSSGL